MKSMLLTKQYLKEMGVTWVHCFPKTRPYPYAIFLNYFMEVVSDKDLSLVIGFCGKSKFFKELVSEAYVLESVITSSDGEKILNVSYYEPRFF